MSMSEEAPIAAPSLDSQSTRAHSTLLRVDRVRAATRGTWLVALAALMLLAGGAMARSIRWQTMWAADRVTLLAMAFLICVLAALALSLLFSGGRWLLLATWPGPLRIECADGYLMLALGPFGTHQLDRASMRVTPPEPVEEAFSGIDDEPLPPTIHHAALAGDVGHWIVRFSDATPGQIASALARYLP